MFKKIKPNPFFIIEKATLIFQNLHGILTKSYLHNEGHIVPSMVEKLIRWTPPINGRFKLNFDGSRVQNRSALDSNGTFKMAANRPDHAFFQPELGWSMWGSLGWTKTAGGLNWRMPDRLGCGRIAAMLTCGL